MSFELLNNTETKKKYKKSLKIKYVILTLKDVVCYVQLVRYEMTDSGLEKTVVGVYDKLSLAVLKAKEDFKRNYDKLHSMTIECKCYDDISATVKDIPEYKVNFIL